MHREEIYIEENSGTVHNILVHKGSGYNEK
jgi:hypothetical protein